MTVDLGSLLNPKLRSIGAIERLREWFESPESVPIGISDFLEDDFAKALEEAHTALPHWQHVLALLESDGEVTDVSLEQWRRALPEKRWSSQQIAAARPILLQQCDLDPVHIQTMAKFFLYFVVGQDFRRWISQITLRSIAKESTCEFSYYRTGDYITRHADRHDSRIIGVNLYLSQWAEGDGGELGYCDDNGSEHMIAPTRNSASLFRILDGCDHWVEPWLSSQPGRRTISLSYQETA